MNKHTKKMIAPVLISVIVILYYVGFFAVCMFIPVPPIFKLLFGMVPLLLSGVCIFVLAERIKEIRSGEEDDLSQY